MEQQCMSNGAISRERHTGVRLRENRRDRLVDRGEARERLWGKQSAETHKLTSYNRVYGFRKFQKHTQTDTQCSKDCRFSTMESAAAAATKTNRKQDL